MKDAIARLKLLLQDEYEVADFRGHQLTAERLSECLTLLDAILRPVQELAGEAELCQIALENMASRIGNVASDDDDRTYHRLQGLIKVTETIEVIA